MPASSPCDLAAWFNTCEQTLFDVRSVYRPVQSNGRASTANEVKDQDDNPDYEQDMDESSSDWNDECAQEPQDDQYDCDGC